MGREEGMEREWGVRKDSDVEKKCRSYYLLILVLSASYLGLERSRYVKSAAEWDETATKFWGM